VSGIKTNLGLHKKAAGRLPKCWRQRSPCWRHNVVMWALTKHSPNRVASGEASRTMCFGYSAALKPHDQVSCMCRYDARQRVSPACVPPLPPWCRIMRYNVGNTNISTSILLRCTECVDSFAGAV